MSYDKFCGFPTNRKNDDDEINKFLNEGGKVERYRDASKVKRSKVKSKDGIKLSSDAEVLKIDE